MKWWSGTKKKCCRTLRHSVSFFYGGLYTTKSFLIDGRLVLCCWVIQKLWRESKAKLCHQKIQYLHSWSWLEKKILKNLYFFNILQRRKKESQSGKDAHFEIKRRLQSRPFFQRFQLGKEFVYCLAIYLCCYSQDFPSIP